MSAGTVSVPTTRPATLDDLAKVDGKAELIDGRIVHQMPTGHLPNRVASRIFRSLDDHAEAAGQGVAYTDSIGFAVPKLPSGRESFTLGLDADAEPAVPGWRILVDRVFSST